MIPYILNYYLNICIEGHRKTTKTYCDSRFLYPTNMKECQPFNCDNRYEYMDFYNHVPCTLSCCDATDRQTDRQLFLHWDYCSNYPYTYSTELNGQLTTMIAILPPTSPTTLIGGFSLAGCTGTPTLTSIVRERERVGGEYRPSTMSDSASFCSPWITAIPKRNLSAYEVAFLAEPGFRATITALR